MRIGVVIPTLNEEEVIERTLCLLLERGSPEIVMVADCDSADRTVELAGGFEVTTLSDASLNSRAAAMNAGAARALAAQPDVEALWFLHADATPPKRWDESIAAALADEQVVGGAFDIRWDYSGVDWFRRMKLKFFQAINRARFRRTHIFYGDQGIFVRPRAFEEVGRMPDVALMEDVILSRRLKRLGRLTLASGLLRTNPRRFLRHGVCRQVLFDLWLLAGERLGVHSARHHESYNHRRARSI